MKGALRSFHSETGDEAVNPFYATARFLYPLKNIRMFSGGKKQWQEIG